MSFALTSYTFGVLSNALWMFVVVPQMYLNYTLKTSGDMSLLLLYTLTFAETCSLFSSYIKNLSIVIIASAIYHIFINFIIIFQILYYRYYNNKKITTIEESLLLFLFFLIHTTFSILLFLVDDIYIKIFTIELIAWTSTLAFILARIPQIVLLYRKKNIKEFSLLSLAIIDATIILFLFSILIAPNSSIQETKQWISGCISTLILDIIIYMQYLYYCKK
jgi:uncharacterized protein with PQ loop repeat